MRVIQKALTFDDVLLVPSHSTVLPREVSLETRLTRTIQLNIPLLSAAMDTVTESRLAIALAQEGGIGIVHKNMPPAAQAETDVQRARAKRALWLRAWEDLLSARQAVAARDNATAIRHARRASELAQLGLEQLAYPAVK